jgi:hypothetical protein
LYNGNEETYNKLLYTRWDFVYSDNLEKIKDLVEIKDLDKDIKAKTKNFFLWLKKEKIIKNLIDLKQRSYDDINWIEVKELFEIELLDSKKVKIILKDNNHILLIVDSENIWNSLEELFSSANKFNIEYLSSGYNSLVWKIVKETNDISLPVNIWLNFTKHFSNIEHKMNVLRWQSGLDKLNKKKKETLLYKKESIKGVWVSFIWDNNRAIIDYYDLNTIYISENKLIKIKKENTTRMKEFNSNWAWFKESNWTEFEQLIKEDYLDFNEVWINLYDKSIYRIRNSNKFLIKFILVNNLEKFDDKDLSWLKSLSYWSDKYGFNLNMNFSKRKWLVLNKEEFKVTDNFDYVLDLDLKRLQYW